MALSIVTTIEDQAAVVAAVGEVDVSCADQLRDAIDQALADVVGKVTVDLSQVPYIDSTGIGVLVGAVHRAQDAGKTLTVAHPQRNVRRVLDMLAVSSELGVDAQEA